MRRSTSRIGRLPKDVLETVNEHLYAGMDYRTLRRWLFEQVAEEDVPALGLKKGEKFSEVWLRAATSRCNAGHFCDLALSNWYRGWHQEWVKKKLLGSEVMRVVRRAKMLTQVARSRVASNRVARSRVAGGRGLEEREESGEDYGDLRSMDRRGQETGAERPEEEEAVSIDGGDILMRSVLIDAVSAVTNFGGRSSFAKASAVAPGAMADTMADSRPPAAAREIAQLANAWAKLKETTMSEEKLRLKTEDSRKAAFDEIARDVRHNPEALELYCKLREVMERERAK